MDISKERRRALFGEITNFFDMQGGIPADWKAEIDQIYPEDACDELYVVVKHLCFDWGMADARGYLEMIGAHPDEITVLIDEVM